MPAAAPTPTMQGLLLVNIGVFAATQLLGLNLWTFALWPLDSNAHSWGQLPVRLLTYSFLHANGIHLLVNMLALVVFGPAVEQRLGSRPFLVFYLGSVVTAALVHLLVSPLLEQGRAPTVGASGGVFGLLLAFGSLFPQQRLMLLFPPVVLQARTLVYLAAGVEMLFAITRILPGIAHFAHLGGMLGGWLMLQWLRGRRGER